MHYWRYRIRTAEKRHRSADLREKAFHQHEPWVTGFPIEGGWLGGTYRAAEDRRLERLFAKYPALGRVLELGCLEGGHSFPIAERATSVIAIDGRQENLDRAEWVRQWFPRPNLRFLCENLEEFELESLGPFDLVLNLGLLYHLPQPWLLLQKSARVAPVMHLWTHVAPNDNAPCIRNGYAGLDYAEFGLRDPLSGMSDHSFWPTQSELERMLADCGYARLECVDQDPVHPHGPAVEYFCYTN